MKRTKTTYVQENWLNFFGIILVIGIGPVTQAFTNIALQKSIISDSLDKQKVFITDGDENTCAYARMTPGKSWTLDLGGQARILYILNRMDKERTDTELGYSLIVSDTPDWTKNGVTCDSYDPNRTMHIINEHPCMADGRYVTWLYNQSTGSRLLPVPDDTQICEVLIAGCYHGTFGPDCAYKCHCLSGTCDIEYGVCEEPQCQDGWLGIGCDIGCKSGHYGRNCSERCHCQSGHCDPKTGSCEIPGCIHGWQGDSCSVKTPLEKNMDFPESDPKTETTHGSILAVIVTISVLLVLSFVLNLILAFYIYSKIRNHSISKSNLNTENGL